MANWAIERVGLGRPTLKVPEKWHSLDCDGGNEDGEKWTDIYISSISHTFLGSVDGRKLISFLRWGTLNS